jgi:steroid delta-isomerase-like uncharacterized protein
VEAAMEQAEMVRLVERHLKAEGDGDAEGAVAVYADDIIHDAVGDPGSPRKGKQAAREFYRHLSANFRTEKEEPVNRWFAGDTMFLEQIMTGQVIGQMFGIPGKDRRVSVRIFHVFQFAKGFISREQVWLDSGSVVAQLTAP